jgi:hypothetical protein
MANGEVCKNCNGPIIVQSFAGRPKRFCSMACRTEFYDEERRQAVAAFRAAGLKPEMPWKVECCE